jgi:hypothetical protein
LDSNSGLAGNAGLIEQGSSQSADCELPNKIERAWNVRERSAGPAEHEDSSAAQVEDAKFENSRGFIIDPTVSVGAGRPEEALTEGRKTSDAG